MNDTYKGCFLKDFKLLFTNDESHSSEDDKQTEKHPSIYVKSYVILRWRKKKEISKVVFND